MLPNDIIIFLLRFLRLHQLKNFNTLSKTISNESLKYCKYLFIEKYFPKRIKDLFLNNSIYKQPILNFKHEFIGDDYIDGISEKDVNNSIMIGIDLPWKRPFITLKLETKSNGNKKIITVTLFKRYTSLDSRWAFGSPYREAFFASNLESVYYKIQYLIAGYTITIGKNQFKLA